MNFDLDLWLHLDMIDRQMIDYRQADRKTDEREMCVCEVSKAKKTPISLISKWVVFKELLPPNPHHLSDVTNLEKYTNDNGFPPINIISYYLSLSYIKHQKAAIS